MRMLVAWNNGTPIYLLLASASVMLLFCDKGNGIHNCRHDADRVRLCLDIGGWLAQLDLIDKIKYVYIVLAHLLLLAVALYYRSDLKEGAKTFYRTFIPEGKPGQEIVLLGIVVTAFGGACGLARLSRLAR